MQVPATIAAEAALLRQNVALSTIKQAAKADQQIANILQDSLTNVAASSRGKNVNFSA